MEARFESATEPLHTITDTNPINGRSQAWLDKPLPQYYPLGINIEKGQDSKDLRSA